MALGESVGHQRSHRGDVDLQRVDAQVGLAGVLGQPLGEGLQVELASGALEILDLLRGEELQRMLLVAHRAAADRQALFGLLLPDPALGDQLAEQVAEVQQAVLGGGGEHGHADSFG